MLTIALVGRPNVGKSTLFNRLTQTRHALVDPTPGLTRDRRYGKGSLAGMDFTIIDTAGLEEAERGTTTERMMQQTQTAMKEADLLLFIVDGRTGLTQEDRGFAAAVRKSGKPMVLVVNKAENGAGVQTASESYSLGLGEPVAISAEHGEGLADLYEAIARHEDSGFGIQDSGKKQRKTKDGGASATTPLEGERSGGDCSEGACSPPDEINHSLMQIAIVGRPNAGKSTLLNRMVREERVLTGPEAGLTRDAISVDFTFKDRALKLVDTAGMRKRGNVSAKIEKMAVADTLRSIQYAHVVVLVLDAETALEKQDNTIAGLVEREGRALVIALNKWDKVKDKQFYIDALYERMVDVMPQVKGITVVPVVATEGKNIDKLLAACFEAYDDWNRRIGTGELNRWLETALETHVPPMIKGRRIKIRYITQHKTRPPTFVIFGTQVKELPDAYTRYLLNHFRETFKMPGVPIRIHLRQSKNPYDE